MGAPERPARPENGRRDLMDIAIDCFARYGYQATSIDRIARAAGLTKGAIYYHFKDKEELLFEAVKNRVTQFERRVIGDLGPIHDAAAALRRVTQVCLEHATKSNHRRLIVTLMVEALDTNARLSAQFREMMHRFRAFLRSIVEVGQRHGVFRADISAVTAAGVYAAAVMGAEIQYYQDPEAIDLGEHLHTFLDQYLTWLAAPASRAGRTRHDQFRTERRPTTRS
jgi:TetR/AcrR family acrAB operon transcriptional repressor